MHHSSVFRIIRQDLRLKCFKNAEHRHWPLQTASHDSFEPDCQTVLLLRKFPQSAVDFTFFSDEKIFTIAAPVNLQNDRIYAAEGVKKRDIPANRLLRTRPTFSKSLMVSVAVSKLGCTELMFVKPGAKVDGAFWTFTTTLVVRVDYLYQVFSILKPFSWSYNKKFRGPVFLKHSVVLRGDSAVARWTCDLHVAG